MLQRNPGCSSTTSRLATWTGFRGIQSLFIKKEIKMLRGSERPNELFFIKFDEGLKIFSFSPENTYWLPI